MTRKRRRPTPGFGIPPPYNPITGGHANLRYEGIHPHCAMMQVAVEDTHANYVICRGYDPRVKKFFDYVEGDADKIGIPVAKPWSNRTVGSYTVGHVFPAVIPLTRIGQSPGVAATSDGQPADLDEEVDILYADGGTVVNWILIDSSSTFARCRCQLTAAMATSDAYKNVDNVVATSGSSPLDDPTDMAETLKVYNTYNWDGDNGSSTIQCVIVWCTDSDPDDIGGYWEFDYVPCTA